MTENQEIVHKSPRLSLFQSISLGIKVILSEIRWNIIKIFRIWEIKRIEKKLQKEYQNLGRSVFDLDQSGQAQKEHVNSEIDLCKRQIEFLKKELESLNKDLQKVRDNIILQRCNKWSI